MEKTVAIDSGRLILARSAGTVSYVDARTVKVKPAGGKEEEYKLNHNQDKVDILRSNIEKLEEIIDERDAEKLTNYIKSRVKDTLNIDLEIVGTD